MRMSHSPALVIVAVAAAVAVEVAVEVAVVAEVDQGPNPCRTWSVSFHSRFDRMP